MRFLITGAGGFVGSHLIDTLRPPETEVCGEGFEEIGRRKDLTAISEMTGWTPSRDADEAIDDLIANESSTGSTDGRLRIAG